MSKLQEIAEAEEAMLAMDDEIENMRIFIAVADSALKEDVGISKDFLRQRRSYFISRRQELCEKRLFMMAFVKVRNTEARLAS